MAVTVKEKKNNQILQIKEKKENKFKKPFQVKEKPEKKDPLRKFYTSLLQQNKKSFMAIKWCLERGLIVSNKIDEYALILKMQNIKI
jgi:hypothetical protein